jgi:hypothetical protein
MVGDPHRRNRHGKALRTHTDTKQWYARQMAAAQRVLADAKQVLPNAHVAVGKAKREILRQEAAATGDCPRAGGGRYRLQEKPRAAWSRGGEGGWVPSWPESPENGSGDVAAGAWGRPKRETHAETHTETLTETDTESHTQETDTETHTEAHTETHIETHTETHNRDTQQRHRDTRRDTH